MINFSIFDDQPLIYGLSKKNDGPMNFRFPENRQEFLTRNDLTEKLILPRLQHGNGVVSINKENISGDFQADALITKEKGILLGVTVADCFPVYFFDSVTQAIGIAHCGWRGVLKNIVPEMISVFKNNFGSKPENILLAIGPGLRFCHFVVQDDVIGQFAGYESFTPTPDKDNRTFGLQANPHQVWGFIEKKEDGYYVDLEKIIHYQAMKNGVRIVEVAGICTFEKEDYFSYRRDKKEQVDSMLAYIGLK
ncbi:MAG: polyphenol oxidase family protein [bacterium]|nr:polyphenol oxidase family protein [bacterium]